MAICMGQYVDLLGRSTPPGPHLAWEISPCLEPAVRKRLEIEISIPDKKNEDYLSLICHANVVNIQKKCLANK